MENEIWKPVKGYEGVYEISNLGRIKSLARHTNHGHYRRERISIGSKSVEGYLRVVLRNEGVLTHFTVHRLVALMFIPNPENKLTVNHINGIKTDNKLSNLEWATNSENSQHSFNIGLQKGRKGEKHHGNKITKKDVLFIRSNKHRFTGYELAKMFNVSQGLISLIVNRKNWKHI